MAVKIKDTNNSINELIKRNDNILKGLERYNDNKKRKIKQTPSKELKEGLIELKKHAKGTKYAKEHLNSNSFYYEDEVPEIEKDSKTGLDRLIVTANSLPIFVALLENVAIKGILNGIYEIPYYKQKFYKNMKKGNWIVGKDIKEGKYIIRSLVGEGVIEIYDKGKCIMSQNLKDTTRREECDFSVILKTGNTLSIRLKEVQIIYD